MTRNRHRWSSTAMLLALGAAAGGCGGCFEDDDTVSPSVLAHECDRLLVTDSQDDLRGCADPQCRDRPQCQATWTSHTDATFGSASALPEGESEQVIHTTLLPSLAGDWTDLDGDNVPDTAAMVACASGDPPTYGLCLPDSPPQLGQYLVSGARLLQERHVVLQPAEALFFSEFQGPDVEGYTTLLYGECTGSTSALDLDGDGHDDLLLAQPLSSSGPCLQLWWGGEALPRPADLLLTTGYDCTTSAVPGDLDGDGTEDLALLNGPALPGTLGLVLGGDRPAALGPEVLHTRITVGSSLPAYTWVVERAGDFVGDGLDDLLLVARCGGMLGAGGVASELCEYANTVLVAAFHGRPEWPAELDLDDADALFTFTVDDFSWPQIRPAAAGDVDGDGRPDLVYFDAHGETLRIDEEMETAGLGVVFKGADGGWDRSSSPVPRYLLPGVAKSGQTFGQAVTVQDLDGDGIDDVIAVDGDNPVYATIAEHYGQPYGDTCYGDCPLKILYHVFRGGPDLVGEPGTWAYPDHLVIDNVGELPGFQGDALNIRIADSSLRIVPDLDGDGRGEWALYSQAYTIWPPIDEDDKTTVIDILSGEPLLQGFLPGP